MSDIRQYPLQELKLIYRILHTQLPQHPELLDSELLQVLQDHLQQQAREAGVDVSHHAQWARWLETATRLKPV